MKANEFVKKYSIDKAKELVSSIIKTISVNGYVCDPCFITDEGEHISYNDLKRHVDSYELVESYGGLIEAKDYLHAIAVSGSDFFDVLYNAIEDVESCK